MCPGTRSIAKMRLWNLFIDKKIYEWLSNLWWILLSFLKYDFNIVGLFCFWKFRHNVIVGNSGQRIPTMLTDTQVTVTKLIVQYVSKVFLIEWLMGFEALRHVLHFVLRQKRAPYSELWYVYRSANFKLSVGIKFRIYSFFL